MRIAFVNHSRRKVGGAEVYLGAVIPAFARAGHELACLFEDDPDSTHDRISIPDEVPQWCVSASSSTMALASLREWHPDICFVHGLHDPDLEAAVVALGCGALYVHNYYGTCISGNKTVDGSTPGPCQRQFGPQCLLHYFPDHCGGRNPFTMLSRYRLQSRRLELMRRYRALIANSGYMARELSAHGLHSDCVYPFTGSVNAAPPCSHDFATDPLRLMFAGRMHALKGGHLLIDSLPDIQRRLARRLSLTFAGDGPERGSWEKQARTITSEAVAFEFTGWLSAVEVQRRIANSHLLIMPSIWPEPFGLSGLEAGQLGVPTVTFAVGGIPEWLHDGINGHLASLPATSRSLADAVVKSLSDPDHYRQLCTGAFARSAAYSLDAHLAQLLQIFERCTA
ncbi:MAG TPA: glycosyltransferase family 4 protein [Terriglobales bacterium]|nr:glycosyltransferase family 4 protein [Terriglobales bacterium]